MKIVAQKIGKMEKRTILLLSFLLLGIIVLSGCSTNESNKNEIPLTGDIVDGVREVTLEAYRYDWSEPVITVRTGETVRIKARSKDVTHGMAIPQIQFNLYIKPGEETVGEFIAPAPGEYVYGCSVMCGPGHHGHSGKLVVIE